MSARPLQWEYSNQHRLLAALDDVRARLEAYRDGTACPPTVLAEAHEMRPKNTSDSGFALDILCTTFGLSPFERDILVMCAGVELQSGFARLCASIHGGERQTQPTFGIALAALPGAHWSAITPVGALRHWRLIEIQPGESLTESAIRIDERVLHYLTGLSYIDERLHPYVQPVQRAGELTSSHKTIAEQIGWHWADVNEGTSLPVIQLLGTDKTGKQSVALAACSAVGLTLHAMPASRLPSNPIECDALLRLWDRDAALTGCGLLLEDADTEAADPGGTSSVMRFIERCRGALVVATGKTYNANSRRILTFEVPKATTADQRSAWMQALGPLGNQCTGTVECISQQFRLATATIEAAALDAMDAVELGTDLHTAVWSACRNRARPRLDDLAQRIDSSATWDDLVLPGAQKQTLRDISAQVRQRSKVYDTWGFRTKISRGLGISALFTGASGTGKTMAGEVLANELELDLYRIDLSQVVSKYIGETEKNLRQVFDAAEAGGAILLFDEADALFGKRSEVKDSHDRYANIEVSYLLQRTEEYRGLAILTTNQKNAIDAAFLRRIRFVVAFPFPDAEQREEIWRRSFPAQTPTADLDLRRLGRMNISGGNIHNIALSAAFKAAEAGHPVTMSHILQAARSEYTKLERPLTEAEVGIA